MIHDYTHNIITFLVIIIANVSLIPQYSVSKDVTKFVELIGFIEQLDKTGTFQILLNLQRQILITH